MSEADFKPCELEGRHVTTQQHPEHECVVTMIHNLNMNVTIGIDIDVQHGVTPTTVASVMATAVADHFRMHKVKMNALPSVGITSWTLNNPRTGTFEGKIG